MASIVQLKRSALSGKVPDTGSLNLGELAVNTYDGKIYFKKSGSIESVESVVTTNSVVTGSIRLEGTGSFGSLKVNDTLTVNHGVSVISGSLGVTSDLTVLGAINARQFNISTISSSVLYESGSSKFGNTSDDIHEFTGSVNVTGSLYLNGIDLSQGNNSGSFSGSFQGDGSGLTGVVSDELPRNGYDYNINDIATINDFNATSSKYLIDFDIDVMIGTPVGHKTYITNFTGSTKVIPAGDSVRFHIQDVEVARIDENGFSGSINFPAGVVSGSQQLTSSYDTRYTLSGSVQPLPNGLISGSSQLTSSVLATTGSNSFIGNQNISGTIYLTGSIIPSGSFVYDLGSETNSFRDLFLSTGSIRFHNPDGTEQGRITVDARSGDISLLKTAGLTNEQKATIGQGNINPDFLSAVSASNLFVQNKIVLPAGGTVHGINLSAFSASVSSTIINQNSATSSYEIKGRGIVSGSSQLTSSYDTRYVVSGSITQTTWDNIASKPAGIISGSSQLTSSYDSRYSLSGSATSTFIRQIETYTATEGQTIFPTTASVTINNVDVYINGFKLLTSDFNITNANTITLTTGSSVGEQVEINLYSAFAGTYLTTTDLTSLNTTTASLNVSVSNLNTATSSYETKGRGIVSGSSQLTSSLATTGSNTFRGTQTLSGSIIPATDNTYDLGSATYQWRDIYVSSGSLYIDGTKVLGSTGNELQITTDVGQSIKILEAGSDSIILQSADGDIQLKTSGGGNLLFDPTTGLIDVRGTLQIQDGNKITSSGGNSIQFGNDLGITGSINTTGNINGVNLTTLSSSIATQISTIQTNTGSSNIRLSNLESKSASVDTSITNINSFTASNGNTSLNNLTGSLATTGSNTFFGTQTFSGSVYIANDLIVQGSSSIQYISASSVSIGTNIVQLNTANPSVRFAGLTIIDSGSVGGSGSFLYDSIQDEFIFVHRGNGTNVTSSHFVLGPETYDSLGNETYLTTNKLPKGTGKEHLNDSNITDTGTLITLGSNTTITGTLLATGTTLVSSSTQVIGILSSLNTYTGSNDTTNTAQNSRLTTIESVTGSYETKGRSIVSGSSQIDVMSTTNIARLATTGSNTFTGNQTISGSTIFRNNSNGTNVSIGGTAYGIRIDNGGSFSTGRSTIFGVDNTFLASYQPLGLQGSTVYIGTSGTDIMTVASTGVSVVGNISAGATNTSYVGPSQYGGVVFPRGQILFSNTNSQNQFYLSSNAYTNASGVFAYRNSAQPALALGLDNGAFSFSAAGNGTADATISWTTPLSISNAGVSTFGGNVIPDGNGTRDLGSASARWSTVYTSDLSLNNGIGDWTIVEGEDDLFLYNNKKGKVYKFALTEVDPNVATPKKS